MRSIGRVSAQAVRDYFALCDRIERGEQSFRNIQEVFSLLLHRGEQRVLVRRYGLRHAQFLASRRKVTLAAIGSEEKVTRERVRQVEAAAFEKLRSRMAQTCLRPFYGVITAYIRQRNGLIENTETEALTGSGWLAGYTPGGVFLLLHDVAPDPFTAFRGLFSVFPVEKLERTLGRAIALLEKTARPMVTEEVFKQLRLSPSEWSVDTLRKLLDQSPRIGVTRSGRRFLFSAASDYLLEQLLRERDNRPEHYRHLAERFNAQLAPSSRKGAGFVLQQLNASPRFKRVERSYYGLHS